MLADGELIQLKELRNKAIQFLENNGDGTCNYCSQGKKDPSSSDNPTKAIISLKNDRETKYGTYITVQNELVGAYNDLRNREAMRLFKRKFTDMEAEYLKQETPANHQRTVKGRIDQDTGHVSTEAVGSRNFLVYGNSGKLTSF